MNYYLFIAFYTTLSTLGIMAIDVYLPSLPAITEYFQTSNTLVQLTIPAYTLSFAISPLIFGFLSDALGRRQIIIAALCLSSLATLACVFAANISWLILARFVQGIGFGAIRICAQAMVPDRFRGAEMAKIMGINSVLTPVILALSPPIGGLIQEQWGWHYVFLFLFALVTMLLIWASLKLKETHPNPQPVNWRMLFTNYLEVCKQKSFIFYGMVVSVIVIAPSSYFTASPFLFQKYFNFSPSEYGYLAIVIFSVISLSGMVNTKCILWLSLETLIYIGCSMNIASSVLLILLHLSGYLTAVSAILACLLSFASINFIFPNGYALAFKDAKVHFGASMAVMGALQMLVFMFSSLMISILPESSFIPLAFMFFLAGFLSLSLMICRKWVL